MPAVKRRFTLTGEANGVQVFDDYGHHPVEIKAVLAAAREACKGRIIAVHQPHRYSRLSSLFDDFAHCFNDADTIILAPVYAAGEDPIEGASSEALVSAIKAAYYRDARFLENGKISRQWLQALRIRAISWFSWGPEISRNGRQRCLRN